VNNNNNNNNRNDNAANTNSISNAESNSNPEVMTATQVMTVAGGVGRRKKRESDEKSKIVISWHKNGTAVAEIPGLYPFQVRRDGVMLDDNFLNSAAAGIALAHNAWKLSDRTTDSVGCQGGSSPMLSNYLGSFSTLVSTSRL
jgi:hypothetical protein